MFPISYRDLEPMFQDRGVDADHTAIFRWKQAYAAELEKRIRPQLQMSNGYWRVDETYVPMKGGWTYVYRAVDSRWSHDFRPDAPPLALSGSLGRPWPAAHGEPAHDYGVQERSLPEGGDGNLSKRRPGGFPGYDNAYI